ncbi:MAG: methionyl-tRNA formyltransferase [Candidatus Izemoplasmatales bacterium]|nr:methionyl-tRNA formyltransferase [Candidatus Izemoplasmatales bacterium]
MKICFMGSMDFAVNILETLHEKYEVSLVVTQPDKPVGRKQLMEGTPVKNKALELGIELFQPISIKKDYQRIIDEDFDFIIVAAYGQIIPEKVLFHARYQAINVHASLLPKYRGGSPMHKAIIDGNEETGVSIIYMEKAMDSGLILSQATCKIEESDNVKDIEMKLSEIGKTLLVETMERLLSGEKFGFSQEKNEVTFAYNFKKEELEIDFHKTSKQIYDFVRGLNPWPVSYMTINGLNIKVYEVAFHEEDLSSNVSEIVKVDKSGVYIQTGSGVIVLKDLQLQGKKRMDIKSFMNGAGKALLQVGMIIKDHL